MERVRWVEHKGKQILYIDYTNLRASIPEQKTQAMETIKKVKEIADGLNSKTLFLSDVTNSIPDQQILDELKKLAAYTNAKQIVEKECVVGVSSIQKVLMNIINFVSRAKLTMFDKPEEAKDWLVQP
jgi:DNA polymerase elongation subunit (family B)